MICAKANFLTANYEKAASLLQDVLKIDSNYEHALCWYALTDFYTYRDEVQDKNKILKIKRAESYFLGIP